MLFNKKILFQIRRYRHSNVHLKVLQDAFGLAVPEANKFLRNIRQTDPDKFSGCIKMCKNLGFSDEEILEYPGLLNGPPMVLEQHFMTLEEGGFHKITPYILLKYRKFFSKPINDLKADRLIKKKVNVAKSFASYFDPQPDANIINYSELTDNYQWRDVHYRLLKMYLKWRLQATSEEIDLLFRIHKMVKNKSIRLLCENIHLALEVGLSLRRIVRSGYILHSYPKYTKEVLRDFHNIAGGDLKKAIMGCPKLLMVSPKNYAKIYGILKEHEISDDAIRNQLNIFQLSPQTVKYRLEEIDNIPELKILKHNVNFLKLVVHHQRAKSRLSFLQELQMKCLPLSILSQDGSIDTHVRNGMDINKIRDVLALVKSLLGRDPKQFEKLLRKHPYHLAVPLQRIEDTFHCLGEMKFSNDAICKVPTILLYPRATIKAALKEVRSNSMTENAVISQSQRLNLVLYTIEKKHHFTGNGVWLDPSSHIETNSANKD